MCLGRHSKERIFYSCRDAPRRFWLYNLNMSDHRPPRQTPSRLDYGEQDENGIDLSLIRENLRLTPLERIRKADVARRQTLKLIEYGKQHRRNAVRTDH